MQAQRFDGELEFLFMDGRSEDRTRQILEELSNEDPRIRVFDNPGRTSTAGLNVGLRNARGDYVVRMDAHTFYPEDYIARGVERLRRGDVVWVAGPQVPYGVGTWSSRVAIALQSWLGTGGSARWGAAEDGAGADAGERELDTGVFAGLWRRDTVEQHGGWDEGWPINQDSELAARVRGLGRQYWRYGTYRAKTAARHPESLDMRHLFAPGLAAAAVGAILAPRPLRGLARAALAAYGAAVVAAGVRALPEAGPRDAVALPVVFAVMHGAWGFGFFAGSLRFGPPLAALARIARRGGA